MNGDLQDSAFQVGTQPLLNALLYHQSPGHSLRPLKATLRMGLEGTECAPPVSCAYRVHVATGVFRMPSGLDE
jgi:hypothetical protein